VLLILVLTFNLYGTFSYYTNLSYQRENWRAAITMLHENYDPETTIAVFSFNAPFAPWSWYERQAAHPFPTLSTGTYAVASLNGQLNSLLAPTTNYQQIISFDYLRSLTDPNNQLPAALEKNGFGEIANYDYNTLGFIRIYARQY
jgi:hypothetical protein